MTLIQNLGIDTRLRVLDKGGANETFCSPPVHFVIDNLDKKNTTRRLVAGYGIVKQSNGFLNITANRYKEHTIEVYLLRHSGGSGHKHLESPADIPMGQGEIVLPAEDDGSILKLAQTILLDSAAQ